MGLLRPQAKIHPFNLVCDEATAFIFFVHLFGLKSASKEVQQPLTHFKCLGKKNYVWKTFLRVLLSNVTDAWLVWMPGVLSHSHTHTHHQPSLALHCCPSFSLREVSCVMNFVQIPDNAPHVTELVKSVALNPVHRKSISVGIGPSCRWKIIHTLGFSKWGRKAPCFFLLSNCVGVFALSVLR